MSNWRATSLTVLLAVSFSIAACTPPATGPKVTPIPPGANALVDTLQERSFHYFWDRTNAQNGLVPDRWPTPSFSSIAAIGFGLTAYLVGVEHGWITRTDARDRVLTTLRFLWGLPQGPGTTGVAGFHGLFYHFLDMQTGLRYQTIELSTIDTALLMAGVLSCRDYFDGSDSSEVAIRAYADSLYTRVDWQWASPRPPAIAMGYSPEHGFLPDDWHGYNEAMIMYLLALGSPTHPIDSTAWQSWTSGYEWGTSNGQQFVQFGPLFGYQYSHVWVDFRGIRDAYMQAHGIDYFENARRATYAQRAYAAANPLGWRAYSDSIWGLTACDGLGDTTLVIDGRSRTFHGYYARGPFGVVGSGTEDGTLAPTAAASSIAFAPEIVLPAVYAMRHTFGDDLFSTYGFLDAFNPTFRVQRSGTHPGRDTPNGWFDVDYLGIDQGPIVAMIENYRTGLVWRVMRSDPYIKRGLQRAGFTGGWLQ